MKLRLHPFELQLAHPFGIARGVRTSQASLIVELEEDGLRGYGEATANAYYNVTVEGMMQELENLRDIIEQTPVDPPEIFWSTMHAHLQESPFSLCALDEAANDLYGKKRGKPLH